MPGMFIERYLDSLHLQWNIIKLQDIHNTFSSCHGLVLFTYG